MIGKLKIQISIVIASIVLGFLLVIQFQAQTRVENAKLASGNLQDLSVTLLQVETANDNISNEIKKLRDTLNKYETGESRKNIIKEELYNTKVLAGLVALKGPGVEITLADSPKALSYSERNDDGDLYLIHDYYLRSIVNTLWNAGAEAVSINNNRIISTSEIFCGGSSIFVNKNYLSSPFVIKAIGEPNTLNTAVNTFSEFNRLKTDPYGIKAYLTMSKSVIINGIDEKEVPIFTQTKIVKE